MNGTVYCGINTIYTVRDEGGKFLECRIKGKVLSEKENSYNPLAPGDQVEFQPLEEGRGLIHSRCERKNRFARWNRKRDCWQTIAANLDALIILTSGSSPPFRPRFVDRVLINAIYWDVPAMIVINKSDLDNPSDMEERLASWIALGIPLLRCSAKTGEGMGAIQQFVEGKTVTLFGQSGVGKSTLVNALIPGLNLPTADISRKHNRGRHVTNFGRMLDAPWNGRIIDTPGVREILVRGIDADQLPLYFPEIGAAGKACEYSSCRHREEPGCSVMQECKMGHIHPDRYENYIRLRLELEGHF